MPAAIGGSSNTTNTSGAKDKDSMAAFKEGDRVLAYHGPLLYEAKVQKTENRENEWRYFIHFLGWNKYWDEWVASGRLLKLTEENVSKQQELEKNQAVDKNIKSGRSTQHKPKGSNADAKADKEDTKGLVKGKKRKSQPGTDKEDTKGKKRKRTPRGRNARGHYDVFFLLRPPLLPSHRATDPRYPSRRLILTDI